jgi:VCBS repeat-containing protein
VNNLTTGQTATDTMGYTASAGGQTSSATLTVTINGHTDTAFNAVDDTATIAEDATPNTATGNVLTNDTNAAVTPTVTAVNGVPGNVATDVPGLHGTFHINANGDYIYTLNNGDAAVNALTTGQTLIDSMPYTASDGTTSSSATLTVTIQGHTDTAFNAVDDAFSITEDATPNTITGANVNVLTNDTNAAGTTTVTAVNGVAGNVGTAVQGQFGTFNIASNGGLTYTLDNTNTQVNGLNNGQTLTDIMPYTASDGTTSSTAKVRITINGHTD